MKKWLLSGFVVFVILAYIISQRTNTPQEQVVVENTAVVTPADVQPTPTTTQPATTTEPTATTSTPVVPAPTSKNPTPTTVKPTTPIPTPAPAVTGMYKDGEYAGVVADAIFGDLQVKVVIKNGKLASVVWLKYPNDSATSKQINTGAMSQLNTEAIQIQNAKVNVVSGATQTSAAYRVSLAAALAKAKA